MYFCEVYPAYASSIKIGQILTFPLLIVSFAAGLYLYFGQILCFLKYFPDCTEYRILNWSFSSIFSYFSLHGKSYPSSFSVQYRDDIVQPVVGILFEVIKQQSRSKRHMITLSELIKQQKQTANDWLRNPTLSHGLPMIQSNWECHSLHKHVLTLGISDYQTPYYWCLWLHKHAIRPPNTNTQTQTCDMC